MKKRIKDLTIGEIKKICRSFDDSDCSKCPLYKVLCDDLELYYMTKVHMNKKVEI